MYWPVIHGLSLMWPVLPKELPTPGLTDDLKSYLKCLKLIEVAFPEQMGSQMSGTPLSLQQSE